MNDGLSLLTIGAIGAARTAVTHHGGATLSGGAGVSPQGKVDGFASGTLAAAAVATAGGERAVTGVVVLGGFGLVVATPFDAAPHASVAGAAGLVATAIAVDLGDATLAAAAAVTPVPLRSVQATSTVSADGVVVPGGVVIKFAQATFTGTATVVATGTEPPPSATVGATASVAASALRAVLADGTVPAAGAVTAGGTAGRLASATLGGTASLMARPVNTYPLISVVGTSADYRDYVDLVYPTGMQDGDLVLFFTSAANLASSAIGPTNKTGWTSLYELDLNDGNDWGACWYRVGTASQSGTNLDWLGSQGISVAVLVVLRNVGLPRTYVASGKGSSTVPAVTAYEEDRLLAVLHGMWEKNDPAQVAPPTGFTQIREYEYTDEIVNVSRRVVTTNGLQSSAAFVDPQGSIYNRATGIVLDPPAPSIVGTASLGGTASVVATEGGAPSVPGTATIGAVASMSATARFDPKDVAGLRGWWDADDATSVVTSGSTVTAWNDKSTAGLHLTSITGAPAWGTRFVNGRNTIDLNGSSALERANTPLNTSGNRSWTIFAVAVTDSVAAGVANLLDGDDASGSTRVGQYLRRNGANLESIGFSSSTTYTATKVGLAANQTFLMRSVVTSNASIQSALDSVRSPSVTMGAQNHDSTQMLSVGRRLTANYWDGAVCEIIVYNAALSAADIRRVEDYLAAKWAVTLPRATWPTTAGVAASGTAVPVEGGIFRAVAQFAPSNITISQVASSTRAAVASVSAVDASPDPILIGTASTRINNGTLTIPSGLQTGDLLVLQCGSRNNSGDHRPTDYLTAWNRVVNQNTGNDKGRVFIRTVTAGDIAGGNVTVEQSGGETVWSLLAVRYLGAYVAAAGPSTVGASIPTVAGGQAGGAILSGGNFFWHVANSNAALPSAWLQLQKYITGGEGTLIGRRRLIAAGNTPTGTMTMDNVNYCLPFSILFAPPT